MVVDQRFGMTRGVVLVVAGLSIGGGFSDGGLAYVRGSDRGRLVVVRRMWEALVALLVDRFWRERGRERDFVCT